MITKRKQRLKILTFSAGGWIYSWLTPGPIFLRTNKNNNLVDKVELVDVNLTYANICYPDGQESTISLQDLAPYSAPQEKSFNINENRIIESHDNVTVEVLNKKPITKNHI